MIKNRASIPSSSVDSDVVLTYRGDTTAKGMVQEGKMQTMVAWIRKNEGKKDVEPWICYLAWEAGSKYESTTS